MFGGFGPINVKGEGNLNLMDLGQKVFAVRIA
jgi:hypothetical protein